MVIDQDYNLFIDPFTEPVEALCCALQMNNADLVTLGFTSRLIAYKSSNYGVITLKMFGVKVQEHPDTCFHHKHSKLRRVHKLLLLFSLFKFNI